MERRTFIKQTCISCIGGVAVATIFNACAPTRYVNGKLIENGLIVDKNQFRVGDKGSYSRFIVVRNESLLFPICIFRFSEQEYSAIWMKCAHQGAEVNVVGDMLQCPAHGSEYDNKGNVTNGPATTNLRVFPVEVGKNELFIDLRKQS